MNKSLAINFISIFLITIMLACGDKSSSSAQSEATKQKAEDQSPFKDERARAYTVLEFRKEQTKELMSSIVANYHEYQAIYDNGMSEKGALAGEWIKFNDDHTYSYGKYETQLGTGKFHHNSESALMLMIDDDASKVPKEYKTQHGASSLLLVGQNTYGPNAVQMFLNRVENKPSKQ